MATVQALLLQAIVLLLGWGIFWWRKPRLAILLLLSVSLFSLCVSPSVWQEQGIAFWLYYDLIQTSPLYSFIRLSVDPWTLPWIYEDSPFHFMAESSRPLIAPALFAVLGLAFMSSNVIRPAHADD